jgi:hypothetical protein
MLIVGGWTFTLPTKLFVLVAVKVNVAELPAVIVWPDPLKFTV